MKFLKRMHKLNDAIDWWVIDHPLYTMLLTAMVGSIGFFSIKYAISLLLGFMLFALFVTLCDGIYMSNYKPNLCDKCNQALPKMRPTKNDE